MRYIKRGPEPAELKDFKAAANADWTPRYADFHKKSAIAGTLAREQGYLCGYCGTRIGARPGDCHIEHVDPQSRNVARALDYTNMLASCQGSDASPPVPAHCGATRGNVPLPVTPFVPDCASYFAFASDGHVNPTSDQGKAAAAKETIRILQLGVKRLTAARAAAIEGAIQDLAGKTSEEWRTAAADLDSVDASGRLAPFCFAIQQVLLSFA